MSGTELAYGARGCPVQNLRLVLGDVRYRASVWCYAMCGTELAYGAMQCAVLSARVVRCVQWGEVHTYYADGAFEFTREEESRCALPTLAQYRASHSTIR
eukprot:2859074-Rhodomonas_salina.1